jgi:hypothetical protein
MTADRHPLHQAADFAMEAAMEFGIPDSVPVGATVLCDDCDMDYTASPLAGGILFQSKALGPCCAPKWEDSARKYGEERFIRARCPEGVSFADWVRGIRGPDAAITVTPGLPGMWRP